MVIVLFECVTHQHFFLSITSGCIIKHSMWLLGLGLVFFCSGKRRAIVSYRFLKPKVSNVFFMLVNIGINYMSNNESLYKKLNLPEFPKVENQYHSYRSKTCVLYINIVFILLSVFFYKELYVE